MITDISENAAAFYIYPEQYFHNSKNLKSPTVSSAIIQNEFRTYTKVYNFFEHV
jgi:hypothetical protein